MAAITNCNDFGAPQIKLATVSTVSPPIYHGVMGLDAMILVFGMLSFKPTFSLSFFTFIKKLFSSSSLSSIRVVLSAYLRSLIFLQAEGCLFTLLIVSFVVQKLLSFIRSHLFIFALISNILGCGS